MQEKSPMSILVPDPFHFRNELFLFNPFAPEPPVTARADPGTFYPLWRHQF